MNAHIKRGLQDSAGSLLGSLIGDALSLGPHWVYDQEEIQRKLGRVTAYHAPLTNYHPGKNAGDLTHYGDQVLVLLRSIQTTGKGSFSLERFASDWKAFWENPKNISYRDGATRQTLEHLQKGASPLEAGSESHDLGGAGRMSPLLLLDWKDDEELIQTVRKETAFTHPSEDVVKAAEFFCRVVLAIRKGLPIPEAMDRVMRTFHQFTLFQESFSEAHKTAISKSSDAEVLKAFGLSCPTKGAFPGVCHLLLRYPEDPETALIENATAGGDNAARGLVLGLVYGAKFPCDFWPIAWVSGLHSYSELLTLVAK